jgi:hypothetical protein
VKQAYYIIIVALSLLLLFNCKNNGDLGGNAILGGTLYYKNTIDGLPDSSVLPNTILYLQYASQGTSSYLYATKTGPDGKFLFSNLTASKSYWIFTTVDTMGLTFTVQQIFKAGVDTLALTITPVNLAQNGFIVQLFDPLNAPLANIPLYCFNSQTLADNNDSAGNIFSLKTDASGNAWKFNLPPGMYYVNAYGTVNNMVFQARDSFMVSDTVFRGKLTADTATNGFSLQVLDSLNTPLPGCSLYVFNSLLLSDSNLSAGSILTLQTNAYGVAQTFDLQKGSYYVNAYDSVGKLVLSGKDTIAISSTGITGSTLIVHQK